MRIALGFFLFVAALAGSWCVKPVRVPAPAQDRPPTITITSFPSGGGNIDPVNINVSGLVWTGFGTNVLVLGTARNPGGVKEFGLKVSQDGTVLYSVKAVDVPDPGGTVSDTLYILGSDGTGNAGSKVSLVFTETAKPATVEASATNYNGMTSSILVTYACLGCPFTGGGPSPTTGTNQPKCGPGGTVTCNAGSNCCNGRCVVNDPQNCGRCGVKCPNDSACQGQQCVTMGEGCATIGQACVPFNQSGIHCCPNPTAKCNFQICKSCTPHGAVVPAFGSQLCCDANDQAVLDPSDGKIKCNIPDCAGPDCP